MMFKPKAQFVSEAGGTLRVADYETGEVLAAVPVRAGIVPMSEYAHLVGVGDWSVSDGLTVLYPRSGYAVQEGRARHETGANPAWRPTSATRIQNEMRVMVNKLVGKALNAEKRERAVKKLIEMPVKRAEPEQPEVEPVEGVEEPAAVRDEPKQ